jgi:ATP-binding protein involved in chromosome partitioning
MNDSLNKTLENIIHSVQAPLCSATLGAINALQSLDVQEKTAILTLRLGYPLSLVAQQVCIDTLKSALQEVEGIVDVVVTIQTHIVSHAVQKGLQPLEGVKNIIAIASGKGGVGKSTVALNIATALSALGAKVGLLDADIYGPSQAHMLKQANPDRSVGQPGLSPVICYGLQTMSIAYLVDPKDAMVWRGPMVTGALQQLLHDTRWQDLDYLIIDLPPGTGDIQLTLAQKVPVSGVLLVTTPQDLALIDVRRAMTMFHKVAVPILGVVENMSVYQCPKCGHQEALFGQGGGKKIADQAGVTCLGEIPLNSNIRQYADDGMPLLVAEPEGALAKNYSDIAIRLAATLSLTTQDKRHKFPKIVIE